MPVGSWPVWWAGLIELVTGLLVAIGFATRPAAFLACGHMAVAYFWRHWPPLEGEPASFWPHENGGELAVLYCFAFLLILFMGPGRLSVDARRPMRTDRPAQQWPAQQWPALPHPRLGQDCSAASVAAG